jgi:hypothetical protein
MSDSPILYAWTGECWEPLKYFREIARQRYVDGQISRLEQVQERSMNSHRHYFACIANAWANVPERDVGRWPTSDHLRRWALTFTRFRETRTYEAASLAEARRYAAHRLQEPDTRVEILGRTVLVHKPMSQSLANMSKREFGESKQAVLDVLAELIGVSPDELASSTRSVA